MSELSKRVLVALIGIPIALVILVVGRLPLAIVVLVISQIGLDEFFKLAKAKGYFPIKIVSHVFLLAFQLLVIYYNLIPSFTSVYYMFLWQPLIIILFLTSLFVLNLWNFKENSIANISSSLFGVVYILIGLTPLIMIRHLSNTFYYYHNIDFNKGNIHFELSQYSNIWGDLLILLFLGVWTCDSAAYFVGRKIGNHKLFPIHSPKKSWEGSIAGFVSVFILLFIFKLTLVAWLTYIDLVVLTIIIGIFGQLGDLAESQMKRDANIKDSGSLLPGHGGVLDRFDSIMFVAPLTLFYFIVKSILKF